MPMIPSKDNDIKRATIRIVFLLNKFWTKFFTKMEQILILTPIYLIYYQDIFFFKCCFIYP